MLCLPGWHVHEEGAGGGSAVRVVDPFAPPHFLDVDGAAPAFDPVLRIRVIENIHALYRKLAT